MELSKIYSFIKNDLTLERVNKYALLVALALLLIRSGDFNSTFMPKPFEVIFVFVAILFVIDLIKNKKIKEFCISVPRNIWLAVGGMIVSVVMGWSITLIFGRFPIDKEMVTEFGRMIIALMTFLLIFFYTRNDKDLLRKYFYALLSPVFYILLLFIPKVADFYNLTLAGRFIGFTNNLNTTTKILVVPAAFFVACALFEEKNRLLKIVYVAVSSCMTALLFWTSSRGGLLAFFAAMIFICAIFAIKNLSWKKIAEASLVVFSIVMLGFLLTPHSGKQVVLERALNSDTEQTHYYGIKDKSLKEIVATSLSGEKEEIKTDPNKDNPNIVGTTISAQELKSPNNSSETRIDIWSYALRQIPYNLLGAGPAFNLLYAYTPLSGGPHNSILQIFFEGGVIGLFCLGYILFLAFDSIKSSLIVNFDKFIFAISGGLLALLIALMFDANVKLFLFWALLAIVININSGIQNEKRQ